MNVIVSFNTKNNPHHVSENVLQSIENSCKRWNCKYIQITDSLQPLGFHDMFTKLYLPRIVKDYDRCLYLDTDIIIKHDAPNPFSFFNNDECCYVVKDMQQTFLSDQIKQEFKNNQLCRPWYDECKRVLGFDLDYKIYNDNFFNAGMFLFTPNKHLYIFDYIINCLKSIQDPYPTIHQVEQALINYTFMYYLRDKLIHIPKEWNYIDPPLDSYNMEGYMYHFTGWYYQKYKTILPNFDLWKK